jgi:hypothetical protein
VWSILFLSSFSGLCKSVQLWLWSFFPIDSFSDWTVVLLWFVFL